MVFMEIHNEDSERDRQQIHWGKQKTPGHRCFLCLAHPQSGWTWHFLQCTHTVRTLQRQLVWEWSAEWRQEQCLCVISVYKIQKKSWIPKLRSWTDSCGLFPGSRKAALQFLLLTIQNHHQQCKTWKEHGKESKEKTYLTKSQLWQFLCHRILLSLELPPIHHGIYVLLPSP